MTGEGTGKEEKMSKNMRLNLVYGAALSIALVVLILVGFVGNNVLGYVVWMVTAIAGGVLVLWQKNRLNTSWVWILLLFTAGFGFPVAVLCLKAKEKDSATLTLTDKGRVAALGSSNSVSIGERGSRILETVAHNPGISVEEVTQRTDTDVFDINSLVDAGLLKKG